MSPGFVDPDAGQDARGKGAGINVDPVGPELRHAHGRMAMHDALAEIAVVVKERIADPQEVFLGLILWGDTWPDAGMDELVAANEMLV